MMHRARDQAVKGSGREKYGTSKKLEKPKITTLPPDKMPKEDPELAIDITDSTTGIRYKRGRFLGKVTIFIALSVNRLLGLFFGKFVF